MKPHRPVHGPRSTPRPPGRRFLADRRHALLTALAILVGFGIVEWVFEHSSLAHHLESEVLRVLPQPSPEPKDIPVVVVDISRDPAFQPAPVGTSAPHTSRTRLLGLIREIAALKPAGIGVDVDLSPEGDPASLPAPPPNTIELLEGCRRIVDEDRVPVHLGIRRTEALGPDSWLYSRRYADLAVTISRPRDPVESMFAALRLPGTNAQASVVLPSLSGALGGHLAGSATGDDGGWLHRFSHPSRIRRPVPEEQRFAIEEFLVDFGPLGFLESSLVEPAGIAANASRFQGRAVLIGDAALEDQSQGPDVAFVARKNRLVPGVLVHACAAWTLARGQLRVLDPVASLLATMAVSLAAIVLIQWLCWRHESDHPTTPIPLLILWTAAYGLLVAGITVGLGAFRYLWLGSLATFGFAVVHTFVEIFEASFDRPAAGAGISGLLRSLVRAPRHGSHGSPAPHPSTTSPDPRQAPGPHSSQSPAPSRKAPPRRRHPK